MEKFPLLLILAKRGAASESILVSTADLSEALLLSQQTMSRDLRFLEEEGYIERKPTPQGTYVHVTKKGVSYLSSIQFDLHGVLNHTTIQSLTGTIVDGLGEGRYYMSQEPYQQSFERLLGYRAYPGTLNLRVDPNKRAQFICTLPQYTVQGFTTPERTFGGINVYPIKLTHGFGAIIIPLRTTHPQQIAEIIAPIHLRETHNLQAGMQITIYAQAKKGEQT